MVASPPSGPEDAALLGLRLRAWLSFMLWLRHKEPKALLPAVQIALKTKVASLMPTNLQRPR